jgi:small subunit ribosomal protein S20
MGLTSGTANASLEDLANVERLVSEAYEEIDKAVVKGVLHKNNAAHKKSRVAKYKRLVAMAAGQFQPQQDHPDWKKYERLMARKKPAMQ